MLLLTLVALVAVLAAYILWERRRYYRLSWQLPGPYALPIIGNGLSFLNIESKFYVKHYPLYELFIMFVLIFFD